MALLRKLHGIVIQVNIVPLLPALLRLQLHLLVDRSCRCPGKRGGVTLTLHGKEHIVRCPRVKPGFGIALQ